MRSLLTEATLAARGETPAAFERRKIPPRGVAPRAALGATRGFHHGLLGEAALLLLAACGGTQEAGLGRSAAVGTDDADGLDVTVTLDQLECVEQNDASAFRDEVYVISAWTGSSEGRRRQPEGGSWLMCGGDEFVPVQVFEGTLRPGEPLALEVAVGEDDTQAERVSNQIDDTLASVGLDFESSQDGTIRVRAAPGEVRDNNLTGLAPLVDLELDEDGRTLAFTSQYSNADGPVHYRGRLSW